MTAFLIWAFLLPLLVGFGLPAILAWRPGWRGMRAGAVYVAILLSIALVLRLFAGEQPGWALLNLSLFTLAFAVFVTGLQRLWPWPLVGQIAAGLIVVIMMGSVFYFGPALESARTTGEVQERLQLALTINPYVVTAASILDVPVLHRKVLYGLGLADYHYGYYPKWGHVALTYVLVGAALAGVGRMIGRPGTRAS